MHYHKGLERDLQRSRQHFDQLWLSGREGMLAHANAETRADAGELDQIAVGTEVEANAREVGPLLQDVPDIGELPVKADQAVIGQFRERSGNAVPVEIASVCMKSERNLADAPAQQCRLAGAHHADRDIRLLLEQVFDRIRCGEFYLESRVRIL